MTGGLKARLVIQQQPQQARMCAMDDAERCIIEPPPIVQMVDEEGRPLVWDFNFMVYVQVRIPAAAPRMFLIMMAVSFFSCCPRTERATCQSFSRPSCRLFAPCLAPRPRPFPSFAISPTSCKPTLSLTTCRCASKAYIASVSRFSTFRRTPLSPLVFA